MALGFYVRRRRGTGTPDLRRRNAVAAGSGL